MVTNERNITGIIFANMHDSAIPSLTKVRTMASVPFGGRYRLIDFPLSNFVNAGIMDIGIITKANYQSLMDHVGSGREWDLSRKRGGLRIIPPYGRKNYGIYRGKIEALGAALSRLSSVKSKHVILSDCEYVANIDLKPFIEAHKSNNADATVMYYKTHLSNEDAKESTVLKFDKTGRLVETMVQPNMSGEFLCSMNIYIFDREFLIKMATGMISKGELSMDSDFLQNHSGDYKIYGYEYKGFIRTIHSLGGFYFANIDLLNKEVRKQLFLKDRPIYTKVRDEAPVHYGMNATVTNSFIADGCIIDGRIENSVIFRGCTVKKGAYVKNSILMQDTVVGEKCELDYAITDKNVTISDYRTIIATSTYPAYIEKKSIV